MIAHAKRYVQENIVELSQELVSWYDTGTRPQDGKIQIAIDLISDVGPYEKVKLAQALIEEQATRYVAKERA